MEARGLISSLYLCCLFSSRRSELWNLCNKCSQFKCALSQSAGQPLGALSLSRRPGNWLACAHCSAHLGGRLEGDLEHSVGQRATIELLDGVERLLVVGHGDKGEALALVGLAVLDHADLLDSSEGAEELPQKTVLGVGRQVVDEQAVALSGPGGAARLVQAGRELAVRVLVERARLAEPRACCQCAGLLRAGQRPTKQSTRMPIMMR